MIPAQCIRAVLAACDRESAGGRRDYAILLVMARLALRGGEVAGLDLGDVDWRAAEVTVRGKGNRTDVLPLPPDAGEAIADYLLHARPSTASRALFVTMVAPFARLGVPSVTCLTSRARAGVARFGPHGMRHAAACELLAGGASMEEIGQLKQAEDYLALRRAGGRSRGYMRTIDPATEVPPADLIVAPQRRKPPYIYSPEEISALVHAAGTITMPLSAFFTDRLMTQRSL